jgi:hypothetical protein
VAAAGTEDQLAWERHWRVHAAVAAILGGLLTLGGAFWRFRILSDPPRVGLLETLEHAAAPGALGGERSLRVATFEYYDDRAATVLASSVVSALGALALAAAITYLALATRFRRPQLPTIVIWLPAVGAVCQALSTVLATLGTNDTIKTFLSGPRTLDAAQDIGAGGLTTLAQILSAGTLALALGIVLIAINAMRVGLVTKFVGIIGIFAGALLVLPLNPLPVILTLWLLLLGVLFLGRWPGGTPPAWRTGQAEPWPGGGRRGGRPAPAPEPEPVVAGAPVPGPGARRRKRKKRT